MTYDDIDDEVTYKVVIKNMVPQTMQELYEAINPVITNAANWSKNTLILKHVQWYAVGGADGQAESELIVDYNTHFIDALNTMPKTIMNDKYGKPNFKFDTPYSQNNDSVVLHHTYMRLVT
jgi:hypothetical protein